MCGIIGIIDNEPVKNKLLEKLNLLEYRGYDSAGITLFDENLFTYKSCGDIDKLIKKTETLKNNACCGIGHTRWATHGKATILNCHPHNDNGNHLSIVHNGIIENYKTLKTALISKGAKFLSDTDSEVIAHLLHYSTMLCNKDKMLELGTTLKGSFAILAVFENEPNTIYALTNHNPLILGMGKNNNMVASDLIALADCTKCLHLSNQLAIIRQNEIELYGISGKKQKQNWEKISLTNDETMLGGFQSFMHKEIYEVPSTIMATYNYLTINHYDKILADYLSGIKSLHFIGCGTALNSGLIATQIAHSFNIRAQGHFASEFRYFTPPLDKDDVCIFISQSGETADTLEALKLAKKMNIKTIAITNNLNSTITKIADLVLPIRAGIEIAVASTKAYNGQLVALLYLVNQIIKGKKNKFNLKKMLLDATKKLDISHLEKEIEKIADKIKDKKNIFFIGKGCDYYTALEASLKLKEITYIDCEGFPAGELKHGSIALIDNNSVVIAITTDFDILDKVENALCEVQSRGATTILLTPFDVKSIADFIVTIPFVHNLAQPITSIIPCQLLALMVANKKGLNPDKPRNLAKSVTVE